MWQHVVKRAETFIMCIVKKKKNPLNLFFYVEEYINQRPEMKAINIVPSCTSLSFPGRLLKSSKQKRDLKKDDQRK